MRSAADALINGEPPPPRGCTFSTGAPQCRLDSGGDALGQRSARLTRIVTATAAALCLSVSALAPAASASDQGPDDPGRILSLLTETVDTTTAYAARIGGYRLDREVMYADSSRLVTKAAYEANGSWEFREFFSPGPGSKSKAASTEYIWDALARSYAYPRPNVPEAARAYRVLKADDDAWLIKPLKALNSGGTMKSSEGKAGFHLAAYLFRSVVLRGWMESPTRVVADFRDERFNSEYRLVVSLGGSGQLTRLDFIGADGTIVVLKVLYDGWSVKQPTGRAAVKVRDYERALQSLNLPGRLWSMAYEAREKSLPATPASILTAAKEAAAKYKRLGLRIGVKVQRIKLGARLQTTNPFTKERFTCDVIAEPPYPDASPQMYCAT